jgi:hypothetical protein
LAAALEPFCVDFNPQLQPSIMVLGDSHSNHWMPGLEKAFPDVGILNIGAGACTPLDGVDSLIEINDLPHQRLCASTMSRAFEILRTSSSITTVVLSSRVATFVSDRPSGKLRSAIDPGDTNAAIYAGALRRTLQEITARGKRAVIILDVPGLGFHPKECLHLRAIEAFNVIRDPCATPQGQVELEQRASRQIIANVVMDFREVSIIDPLDVLCDGKFCYAILDGNMLYRDGDHLNVHGSEYVAGRLLST